MRTLASTFSTRDEAEAASRRLQAIGVGRERIILKDVGATSAGAGAAGAVFVSVKVTTDQVQSVNAILKAGATPVDEAQALPAQAQAQESVAPVAAARPEVPPRPLRVSRAEATAPALGAPISGPTASPGPPPERQSPAAGLADPKRMGRNLIFYGLALVAAFIIGAWLGLVT